MVLGAISIRLAALACALAAGGCSLILDFSDGAVPVDAAIDGPFTQAECDFKEPNENAGAPSVLDVSEVGPAAICSGDDRDFYRVTIPANSSVELKISFMNRPTGDLDLRLYDKTGATVLSQSRGFGNEEKIVCPGASPTCQMLVADDYILEVFPALAGAVNRYDIAITVTP
jgi:hypothetical protein